MAAPDAADRAVDDVRLAAVLLAIAGGRLGGATLVTPGGDAAEAWLAMLVDLRPDFASVVRVPARTRSEQFGGSIDLAATLSAGRRIVQPGLVQRAAGQPLVLLGADRWSETDAAHLLAVHDERPERKGRSLLLALENGSDDEARAPKVLVERLAFRVALAGARTTDFQVPEEWRGRVATAVDRLKRFTCSPQILSSLIETAAALGIGSSRADQMALMAACAHAAWCGRAAVEDEDAEVAVRLVLVPKARSMPPVEDASSSGDVPEDQREPEANQPDQQHDAQNDESVTDDERLADRLIEAAKAAIPDGLLDGLARPSARSGGRDQYTRRSSGAVRKARHGRPIGTTTGDPRHDGPLNLLATIERAAPWQTFRRKFFTTPMVERRIIVLPSDIRVTRFKNDAPSFAIFAVDASGSAAINRMNEAKGAIELLLSECYVRREKVALVAFRGKTADVLLAPTFALARARRALSSLPGGGATPLASGLEAARSIALAGRNAGQSTLVVLLTDGRGNIDLGGVADRKRASADASAVASQYVRDGLAAVLVDTSPAPSTKAAALAKEMGARYVPLPNGGAREIATAVRDNKVASAFAA